MKHLWLIVVGVLVALVFFEAQEAYKWKQIADVRGWQAEQAFGYLAQPVTTLNGKSVSRAEVLDALTQQALAQVKK